MKSVIFAAILIFSGLLVPGAQAFELSVVGNANFSKPSLQVNGSNSSGYSSKAAFGAGVLLGFDLTAVTELELGALYVGRHYTYPISSGQGEDSFYTDEFPAVIRLVALKYVTFGVGLYYALPVGQDTYTVTPTGGNSTSSSSSASDSFRGDFGALGSVGIKFPFGIATSLLLDGRYYYGLTNATKIAGETLKFRDIQALFGVCFSF